VSAPPESEPPSPKLGLTKAEFESVNEPSVEGAPASNDPMEMLRQNRAHERAAGTVYDQSPAPVKKKFRRMRDYLIILVTVDGFFGFMLFLAPNPIVPLGMLFFTAALTWGMFVVIDDY